MCCQLPSDSVKSVAQFKATQEEVDNRLLFYSAASTDYKSIVITSVDADVYAWQDFFYHVLEIRNREIFLTLCLI